MHAGKEILRASGFDPDTDWQPAPDAERTIKATTHKNTTWPAASVPAWANGAETGLKPDTLSAKTDRPAKAYVGRAQKGASEFQDMVDALTLNPHKAAPVIPGNRVSRQTWLSSRTVKTDGQDPLPEEAVLKFKRRSYTVPTHSAKTNRSTGQPTEVTPRWARSELDNRLFLQGYAVYRMDYPIRIVGRYFEPRRDAVKLVPSAHSVMAFMAEPDHRTVRSIARSRRDVYANQTEADTLARALKSERDAIRRDTAPVIPRHPSVKAGNIGLAGLAYRPHGKWFTRVEIPMMEMR